MLKVVAQNFCTKEEKGRFIRPKLGLCFCVIIFVHAVKRLLGIFLSIAKKKSLKGIEKNLKKTFHWHRAIMMLGPVGSETK